MHSGPGKVQAVKRSKRHPTRCLFWVVLILVSGGISAEPPDEKAQHGSPQCLKGLSGELANVASVTDGDTLVLEDQRRVRLIGLNTLEVNASNPSDRAWAEQASDTLEQLIGDDPVVLISGKDQHDRYGRMLAHVLLTNGKLASESLIQAGLGIAVSVGRNNRCARQFSLIEARARESGRGIWASKGAWFVTQATMDREALGFRVVQARIQEIQGSASKQTLLLSNGLLVKMGQSLDSIAPNAAGARNELIGKKVEIRGWLGRKAGHTSVTLHDPSNLRLLEN